MIGKTILHYEIAEKLGEGGMGEVWKAQDTRLDRFVALKFLPEKTGDDPALVERFLREARAASALNHPGICTIHDIGEWEGRRYIVMEYVEGVTLGQKAAQGPLDLETLVEAGIQLADALDAAHAKRIIHRDIKSNNIILSPRGQAKILDFGLAKIVMPAGRTNEAGAADRTVEVGQELTSAGQAVGTVSYMSPEQALGKDVDGRTDIFSLGVVLYELATGQMAFSGSTTAAIFDAILNKAPVSPVSLNPHLPAEMERIVNKALEKDRELRYQSAADLMTDLKRLRRDSSSMTVNAAVAAPRRGVGKWGGLGVAVIAVAALAFGLVSVLGDRGPQPLGLLKTRPLTSLVGVEEQGTWSPDGSFFAFSHSASGPADIYVLSTTGGDPIHLVASEADDMAPRWSPDNRWIAFTSSRGGTHSVYLIPPLGGNTRKLVDLHTPGLSSNTGVGATPWSPDGRFFLCSIQDTTGAQSIWKVDADSGEKIQLTTPPPGSWDVDASWSFDGERIAFSRGMRQESSLFVIAADGSGLSEVLPGNGGGVILETAVSLGYPAWSPDSRSLIFSAWGRTVGSQSIWMLRLGSETPVALVGGAGRAGEAVASRSGKVLYNTYDHQTDLYLRDVASGEERRLTAHTADNGGARFSPDGSRVAYMSSRTGDMEVWVLDLASGKETQLTDSPGLDGIPEWSPDGTEIVFVSARDGGAGPGNHLWISPAGGGAARPMSETQAGGSVRWSPSGRLIGFVALDNNRPSLWVLDRETNEARVVLKDVRHFGWYRDDSHVIVQTHDNQGVGEMHGVDLATGNRVTLTTEPQIEFEVSADGSTVSYCSATSHYNMNLHFLHLTPDASGLPTVVGEAEQVTFGDGEWHVHNGGWSADGKYVVYTRDTDTADMFMVEGVFEPQD